MISKPIGPRRISRLRRVALPATIAAACGVPREGFALISYDERQHRELSVRGVDVAGRGSHAIRDPDRPRRIGKTGQLTLPASLMRRAGLEVGGFVYLLARPGGDGLAIVPAARVRAERRRG